MNCRAQEHPKNVICNNKQVNDAVNALAQAINAQMMNDESRYNVNQFLAPMDCECCGGLIEDERDIHIVEAISRGYEKFDKEAPRMTISETQRTLLCKKCFQRFYMQNRYFFKNSEKEKKNIAAKKSKEYWDEVFRTDPIFSGKPARRSRSYSYDKDETAFGDYGMTPDDFGMY